MHIGEFVRAERLKRGLSQRKLALLSGVSNSEISRMEAGERKKPSPGVLRALAGPLGVSYEVLLMHANYLTAPEAEGGPVSSGEPSMTFPDWAYELPPELLEFVRDEAGRNWQYLRLARDLSRRDISLAELEAMVETWIAVKKRHGNSKT